MITWSLWVFFAGSLLGVVGVVYSEFDVGKAMAAWIFYTFSIPLPFLIFDYLV